MENNNDSNLTSEETEPQTESQISESQEENQEPQEQVNNEVDQNGTKEETDLNSSTESTTTEEKNKEGVEPKIEKVETEEEEDEENENPPIASNSEQIEPNTTENTIEKNNQDIQEEEIKKEETKEEPATEKDETQTEEEDLMITPEQIKLHTEEKTEESTQNVQQDTQEVENKVEETQIQAKEETTSEEGEVEVKKEEEEVKEEIKEEDRSKKVKELVNKIREEISKETRDISLINKYLSEIEEIEGDLEKDEKTPESEEDKKFWEELGIEEDVNKQKVVQEIKRLIELFTSINSKKINVHFATQQAPQEKLGEKDGLMTKSENEEGEFDVYLNLEKNNDQESWLIFWTLARELTLIINNNTNYDQDPLFWNHFKEQLNWVKENLTRDYQEEFKSLLNPSTFPTSSLEMKEFLTIYYPQSDLKEEITEVGTQTDKNLIDQTWKIIQEELVKLVSQELEKNPSEEEKEKLAIKAFVKYDPIQDKEYTILVHHHPQTPFSKKLGELIATTPLKLELENLKETKINPKDFAILSKQKKGLEVYLRDSVDKETYQEILEKISRIN